MSLRRPARHAFAALLTGSVAAQAIAYAARPVLARLFLPEAFGLAATFGALAAVLSIPASGRYEEAALLPADEGEAATLLRLSAVLAGLFAAALALAWPLRHAAAAALGNAALAPLLGLLPVAVLAAAWGRTGENALLRMGAFGAVARRRTAAAAGAAALQTTAAGRGGFGLAAAQTAAQALALVLYAPALPLLRRGLRGAVRPLARRYTSFPLAAVPNGMFNTVAALLPVFTLGKMLGAAPVGLYSQAAGLLAAPVGVVAGAAGQAYVVHASGYRRAGTLAPESETLFARLLGAGLVPLLGLTLCAPDVFAVVLGPAWREAGAFAQWLAPWQLGVLASSPLSRLFDVLQRQGAELLFNAVMFAARLGALLVGGAAAGAPGAVAAFGTVSAIFWIVHTVWVLRLAGVPARRTAFLAADALWRGLPLLAVLALACWWLPPLGTTVAFGIACTVHAYRLARTYRLP